MELIGSYSSGFVLRSADIFMDFRAVRDGFQQRRLPNAQKFFGLLVERS